MKAEDLDLLKRYVEAVIIPRMNTDNVKYPIRDSRVNHLFLKEYTSEFLRDLTGLKDKGHPYNYFGKLFNNPSRLMRMAHLLLKGAKLNNMPLEEQRGLILEILKIIKILKGGNIFNEDKTNIILNEHQLKSLIKNIPLLKSSEDTAKLIQRLCGVLWSYSETPYFVAHDIGMEQHGLYDFESGKIMIRDFFNLKPIELWPECEKFPFKEVRIICLYNKRFKVDFDVFNNIYPNEGNSVEDLKQFYLEADNKALNLEEIDNLINISSSIIQSISEKIESMSEREIAKKYADIYWYRKRPLRDALNKDWRPTRHIYENIEKGEIKPDRTKNLTPDEIKNEMGLI